MINEYNTDMAENELGIEIIPGVRYPFTESGIASDAFNAWMSMSFTAVLGNFDELKPVKHYGEYFQDQDREYEKVGKPGLFEAIMESSNPEGIAAFDQLVDEFNSDLPRIVEQKDGQAIQTFFRRAGELKDSKPNQDQNRTG